MLKVFKNKASLTGFFIVAALLLLICFLMALAGGGLFVSPARYTAYFNKSVKGLQVGSPVMFRGVRVGQISDIHLAKVESTKADDTPDNVLSSLLIEVTMEIDPATLRTKVNVDNSDSNALLTRFKTKQAVDDWLKYMVIHDGLRLQLQFLSFLTGQLYIEMDFFPNSTITKEQVEDLTFKKVLPTQKSPLERIQASVNNAEIGKRLMTLNKGLETLNQFILSGKAEESLNNLHAILQNLAQLSGGAQPIVEDTKLALANLKEVSEKAKTTLDAVNKTLGKVDDVIQDVKDKLLSVRTDEMLNNLHSLSLEMKDAVTDARGVLKTAKDTMEPGAELIQKMEQTMVELEKTAEAFRSLAETLQRNPESILKGR